MRALPIHPACESAPRRTDEEINRLRDSLLNDGQADPIVTWHGQVIDGRHRQDILIAEGKEPLYEKRDALTEADVLRLIWSRMNVRASTPGQRAAWWEVNHPKAENGTNQHTTEGFPKGKTLRQLPSGITQKMIDQISSLRRNAPELHAQVLAGAMTPSKAYKAYRQGSGNAAPPARHGGYRKQAQDAGLVRQKNPSAQEYRALRERIADMIGEPEDAVSRAYLDPELKPKVSAAIEALAAAKAGKKPEQQYEEHRREVATLPESHKAKFERLAATEKRLLETIFRDEVRAEAVKLVPELRDELERERDKYIHKNAALARIKAGVTPLIAEGDYRFLLGVLHPDRVPPDQRERFARAFDIVRKLDTYIEACKL